jgi:hypothetical protein
MKSCWGWEWACVSLKYYIVLQFMLGLCNVLIMLEVFSLPADGVVLLENQCALLI